MDSTLSVYETLSEAGKLRLPEDLAPLEGLISQASSRWVPDLIDRYMRLLISNIEEIGRPVWGPIENRIGCFGPGTKKHWPVVDYVMKKISEKGFTAITMSGYYLANDPTTFYDMNKLLTKQLRDEISIIRSYLYLIYFPRLARRATFFLNDFRAQLRELRGAFEAGIPRMGYTIHYSIFKRNSCIYVSPKYDGAKIPYVECRVEDKNTCEAQWGAVYCPFYHSVRVPAETREFFFGGRDHLYSIRRRDYEIISDLIDNFIATT